MKLPTSGYPIFKILVPSLGRKLSFRPFLMKENKALMIAQLSGDSSIMVENLRSVVSSCCQEEIDMSRLASFDLEYLLCKIRSISVGNILELVLSCDSDEAVHDADPSTRDAHVLIDLESVKIDGLDEYSDEIKISPDCIIKMKPPILEEYQTIIEKNKDMDSISLGISIIAKQIKAIYTKDEVIDCSDITESELVEWLEMLTKEQYDTINEWFSTIPTCSIIAKWKCSHCGKDNTRVIRGFLNFFR